MESEVKFSITYNFGCFTGGIGSGFRKCHLYLGPSQGPVGAGQTALAVLVASTKADRDVVIFSKGAAAIIVASRRKEKSD